MKPITPLTTSEALGVAKEMLASLSHLKVSEAKVMFTILAWFIAGLYHLGYEISKARGEELPDASLIELPATAPTWVDSHSVNCIKCGVLFDEREGITPMDGEGTLCPACVDGAVLP